MYIYIQVNVYVYIHIYIYVSFILYYFGVCVPVVYPSCVVTSWQER